MNYVGRLETDERFCAKARIDRMGVATHHRCEIAASKNGEPPSKIPAPFVLEQPVHYRVRASAGNSPKHRRCPLHVVSELRLEL